MAGKRGNPFLPPLPHVADRDGERDTCINCLILVLFSLIPVSGLSAMCSLLGIFLIVFPNDLQYQRWGDMGDAPAGG